MSASLVPEHVTHIEVKNGRSVLVVSYSERLREAGN